MNAERPRYGIVIDSENCMSCYNCFMACRDEHCGFASKLTAPQPHEGHRWMDIRERERGDDNRLVKTASVPTPCSHCVEPACAEAAEPGAVYTRDDGIVIIDPEKAAGNKAIMDACPIGAIYWNEELGMPQKCTMCAELLDEGFAQPRCVGACPNGALFFGDLDDPGSEVSRKIAQGRVTQLPELDGKATNVIHLNIPTVFLAGTVCAPGDEAVEGATVTLTEKSGGSVRTARTNIFGDWEFEWLEKGGVYELKIEAEGYRAVKAEAAVENDHYFGEVMLETID
ncbi:MAG: carboxypeptidase regulatory-like domain-containing protein [Oscillospiraceae bacterium]|nr:carboxypeptidase regulatory-like domain-containing protein [Oscillospiraceae bacterium]